MYNSGQSGLAHVEEITKNAFEDFGGISYIIYDKVDAYIKYLKNNNITVCSTSNYDVILEQDLDLKAFLRKI